MRRLLALVLVLGLAAPAWAQSPSSAAPPPTAPECRAFDKPPLVNVQMRDGRTLRATLTCLGAEAELVTNGKLSHTPVADILKISEPRDAVWDGPVIGAGFGLLMWALCGSDCDAGYMARATADYALLGLVIDAATSQNKTIYRGARAPALSFRVRF